uniref:Uncharacterized protein n=1 Tax=Staphylococcus epidermidis TaxID=1282 RepID=D2JCV7_STAEP|nr:hypothetical protein SAP024A_005 [Staphylococcus epidermidis]
MVKIKKAEKMICLLAKVNSLVLFTVILIIVYSCSSLVFK